MKTWACQGERLDICPACSTEPARNYLVLIRSTIIINHWLQGRHPVEDKLFSTLPKHESFLFLYISYSWVTITSCLFPPTLRMTGPLLILLAMMRKGEGGWIGPSVECPLTSSSTICWQHHHFTQKILGTAFKKVFAYRFFNLLISISQLPRSLINPHPLNDSCSMFRIFWKNKIDRQKGIPWVKLLEVKWWFD